MVRYQDRGNLRSQPSANAALFAYHPCMCPISTLSGRSPRCHIRICRDLQPKTCRLSLPLFRSTAMIQPLRCLGKAPKNSHGSLRRIGGHDHLHQRSRMRSRRTSTRRRWHGCNSGMRPQTPNHQDAGRSLQKSSRRLLAIAVPWTWHRQAVCHRDTQLDSLLSQASQRRATAFRCAESGPRGL
jgi:hypothetical protein